MLRGDCRDEVFARLGEGLSQASLAYLRLLPPRLDGAALANLRKVASRLGEQPKYWREFIRAFNWRYTLVGCSAALLTRLRFWLVSSGATHR